MSNLVGPYLSSPHYSTLWCRYALVPLEVFVAHAQTILVDVAQAFLQLELPQDDLVSRRSELDPSLYAHKSNAAYASPQHLVVECVFF